jgi:putative ABC transport system ATP-binding protein
MTAPVGTETVVEAASLHRTFADADQTIEALKSVSLKVAKGEFVALVGSSGSGKSTLLHLLGGIDRPSGGSIMIDGKDLAAMPERELTAFRSARIGFVFQYFNLIGSLTLAENVGLPFIVAERRKKEDRDRVADMIELFGLRGREKRSPHTLSAGEQQRIAIARAFLTEPAIVIADEPTGSLDPGTAAETLQLLWESCDNFKQTVVLATHDPQVAAFADRVIFLKEGNLVEELVLGRREDHRDAGPVLDRLRRLTF